MGSRILRIPVDHIEQNFQPSANTYVEQGDLFTNDYENVQSGHYTYTLYFEIPEDLYKYQIGFNPDISSRSWRYFLLAIKKNKLISHIGNSYQKVTYKTIQEVVYNNSSREYTEVPDGRVLGWAEPLEIMGPASAGWYHYKGAQAVSSNEFEVPSDEIIEYFEVNNNDILDLQNTSDNYFAIQVSPYYYYNINDSTNVTIEDKSTTYNKWDLEAFYFEMLVTDIEIYVNPTYPVGVYARKDRDLTVAWDVANSVNRPNTYLWVTESTITITDSEDNSVTYTIQGDDLYHVFDTSDISDLAVGECTVHVESTTNYGWVGEATWTFDLTGETNAPEITSVTQNSYPTISWTVSSQIAWELQISNSEGIVYKTGMVPGDARSYTVPQLLEDGQYSIEMRCTNIYGIITAWDSYFLELAPTKPSAPEGIIVSARADFGISINCNAMETTGKLLAVRRKDSNSVPEVLGEYNGSFVDYLVGLNDPHEYTIRNYVEGYADGEWIDGVLAYSGVVIRDADDYSKYVHVWMSEDRTLNYINADDRSDVLTQCVGRKFPISELGEWLTVERAFTGYVSNEAFKQLQKMKLNSTHVLLQSKEEYFPCYMIISDQGEYNDGRIVSFRMTRIDGDK